MLQLKPERFDLDEFRSQPVALCGKELVADQSGALFWPAQRALIVADLDMGGPQPHATTNGTRTAQLDVCPTLISLAAAIDRYQPETVAVLGGSWHEPEAAGRLRPKDLKVIAMMQEDRRWLWISRSALANGRSALGGELVPDLTLDGITLTEAPRPGATHEIAGQLRPEACVSIYGTCLRRPCFVGNGLRLILPAFGAIAGGLNVLDDAFRTLFGTRGLTVWMLGEEGLYPIAARLLRGD